MVGEIGSMKQGEVPADSPFHSGQPVAVVIGCGDLSMASARALGQRHPLVIVDIDTRRLEAAASALRSEGYAVSHLPCNITDKGSVSALADFVRPSGIRVLAHVAALAPSARDFRLIMSVNLIGAHQVAEALLPLCVQGAAAIFVSSFAAHAGSPDEAIIQLLEQPLEAGFLDRLEQALGPERATPGAAYSLSKNALNRYAERLAVRLGPKGVRVLSVSPGLIDSAMGRRSREHNPESRKLVPMTPLGRQCTVLEVAAVIDFAASDAASFLNGVDILVDGGLRAATRYPREQPL